VIFSIIHAFITLSLFVVNIALYATLYGKMKSIDKPMIDFFAENNCSDGDLQYSVQAYRNFY
jgi:hypothetical protein